MVNVSISRIKPVPQAVICPVSSHLCVQVCVYLAKGLDPQSMDRVMWLEGTNHLTKGKY